MRDACLDLVPRSVAGSLRVALILSAGDLAVRASLATSYLQLDPEDRTAVRRLVLLDAPDAAAWAVAALVGVSTERAERLCERLADAHLLEVVGEDAAGQLRYRMHGLLRTFESLERMRSRAIRAIAANRRNSDRHCVLRELSRSP